MQTRRDFLAVSSAALTAALLPAAVLAQSSLPEVFSNANLGAYSQGALTQAAFERLIGSTFTVFVATDLYAFLTLRSVRNLIPAPSTTPPLLSSTPKAATASPLAGKSTTITSFFLYFSLDGPVFPQAAYTLDNGILGRFAALLVPGQSGGEPGYGATFSYLS